VYFFQQLYPFPWANNPAKACAAAAGGCILIRRSALERIGGLAAIRDALIDDCALARLVKRNGRVGGGRIWLGLADGTWSVRDYGGLAGIWQMVARTAFAELRYSWLRLAAALVAMGTAYIGPPLLALLYPWHGNIACAALGLAAWALMSWTFRPTLRRYRQPVLRAPVLPVAAMFYMAMTIDSALRYLRGRGGLWKGRAQTGGRSPSSVSGNPLPDHWFDHHPPST
jgi:hopene-associated glycosyltransferase HpnB